MCFTIDWANHIVGSKFTVFALFYFVFEGNFPSTSPRGALIWRGDLMEGFLRDQIGGVLFGGAYTWRGLFSEFYGSLTCYSFVLQETPLQKLEEFNISYNWLGDSCGSSLAVILKRCPILNALKLESCGLTSLFAAQGKEFALALKGKYLNF